MVSFQGSGIAPFPGYLGNGYGNNSAQPLPVIIAGAGPAGLVAALTLQKYGTPFVIYEQNASDKVCSDAGRGIDLSPSVIEILGKDLGLSHLLDAAMKPYEYIDVSNMDGKHIKTLRFKEMSETKRHITGKRNFGFASRSKLQHILLEALGLIDKNGFIKDSPYGKLRCGIAVTGYKKMVGNFVQVQLDNSMKVKASALLACDGVHSFIRKCMHSGQGDALKFTNQEVWWGTTNVRPGSALEQELQHYAASRKIQGYNVGLVVLGTSQNPGSFYANEVSKNVYNWSYYVESKASNADADLIRRGGKVLDEAEKEGLIATIPSTCKILKLLSESTPTADMNRSFVFDRSNNLRSVDGRVALLGDAAHYNHPLRGEGSNKAMVDGYTAAMRLATAIMGKSKNVSFKSKKSPSIEWVLLCFDSDKRRKANNVQAKKARKYGQGATSNSSYTCWARQTYFKFMSPSKMIRERCASDKANSRFVSDMIKQLEPYPKPAISLARPVIPGSSACDSIEMELTKTKSFHEENVGCAVCIGF
eukprot:scaffold4308_cov152-Skeletonema_menzelii.AAC.7